MSTLLEITGTTVDRHDRLMHKRVARHASVQRENSQQAPEAPGPSSHAESSTSEARASPHATPFSSFRMRRDLPSDASLPPSSHRRQISLV